MAHAFAPHYAPYSEADFDDCVELCREQWYADAPSGKLFATAELTWQLAHAEWGLVARAVTPEGQPGQILGAGFARRGSYTHDARRLQQLDQLKAQVAQAPDTHLAGLELDYAEQALMERVAHERGTRGTGIMQLLVVGAASRGLGVGSALFSAGIDWLASTGATYVRLATDTDCDWTYYEHLGMTRVGSSAPEFDSAPVSDPASAPVADKNPTSVLTHFVYEGPINLFSQRTR